MKTVNPIVQWWMTPKLPVQDIYDLPSLKDKGVASVLSFYVSQWLVHPIKRRLARVYLKFLRIFSPIKVIAITGSAGKTTVSEILALILKRSGNVIWPAEGIDPVYNIPNTILKSNLSTKYLILEMSVEYRGEMDYYLWLASPDIAIITNIYPTHTEFFGDAGGVFDEKSKLPKSLGKNGLSILNGENKFLLKLKGKLRSKIVWFGDRTDAMVSFYKVTKDLKSEFKLTFDQDDKKSIEVKSNILGEQFVSNALAAATTAYKLGSSLTQIKMGIEEYKGSSHRMKIIRKKNSALIFDDSYNNNPSAAKETLKTFLFATGNKNKIVVFGDMLELGKLDRKYHMELGEILGTSKGIVQLICVGKSSKVTAEVAQNDLGKEHVSWAPTYKEAIGLVKPYNKKGNAILVKGSRSIHLEFVVDAIK